MGGQKRILLVEDSYLELSVALAYARITGLSERLRKAGVTVDFAMSFDEAAEMINSTKYNVVVTDCDIYGLGIDRSKNGLRLAKIIRARWGDEVKVIVHSKRLYLGIPPDGYSSWQGAVEEGVIDGYTPKWRGLEQMVIEKGFA